MNVSMTYGFIIMLITCYIGVPWRLHHYACFITTCWYVLAILGWITIGIICIKFWAMYRSGRIRAIYWLVRFKQGYIKIFPHCYSTVQLSLKTELFDEDIWLLKHSSDITVPTHLIWGEFDQVVSTQSKSKNENTRHVFVFVADRFKWNGRVASSTSKPCSRRFVWRTRTYRHSNSTRTLRHQSRWVQI